MINQMITKAIDCRTIAFVKSRLFIKISNSLCKLYKNKLKRVKLGPFMISIEVYDELFLKNNNKKFRNKKLILYQSGKTKLCRSWNTALIDKKTKKKLGYVPNNYITEQVLDLPPRQILGGKTNSYEVRIVEGSWDIQYNEATGQLFLTYSQAIRRINTKGIFTSSQQAI